MIIDFHTHIFPDKIAQSAIKSLEEKSSTEHACTDGTKSGLLGNMKKAGVDIAVALPVLTKATQFESIAKFAISVNEEFDRVGKGVLSFGGMHPECENVFEKLSFLKANGIKGIKLHPDYQETFIDDAKYIEIIKCAKELDLIVVTHSGFDFAYPDKPIRCTPDRVLNVLNQVKYEKLVLAHYGGMQLWGEVYDKLAGKDVYFDISCANGRIDRDLFIKILNKHGADKILFASDCPWNDMEVTKNFLLSFGLDMETLDKILYKNAQKLLDL